MEHRNETINNLQSKLTPGDTYVDCTIIVNNQLIISLEELTLWGITDESQEGTPHHTRFIGCTFIAYHYWLVQEIQWVLAS